MGGREPIPDVSSVVSRMADLAIIRTFEQEKIELFENYSKIPVINALTDEEHPCQALADVMTIYEHLGTLSNKNITFIGDSNNVAKSLAFAVISLGGNFNIVSPKGYEFDEKTSNFLSGINGGEMNKYNNPEDPITNSDIVYTDVWTSMGKESEHKQRESAFKGYQVNQKMMSVANSDALFMHCLPAHRGEEVSADVIDGKQSVVWDEAENRLHIQKALLVSLLNV